jgi:uncharacterized protein DUF3300
MSAIVGRWLRAALATILLALAPNAAVAQASEAELDQLLAPVALYPDALLGNVLAASTYPLEVVALNRWLEGNPGLAAAELEQAVAAEPWDASVKALAPFRDVVAMMNGELDWMQRLGNAFLANESGVMDAVQRLRHRAQEAGSLGDNLRERVIVERDTIMIEPLQPEVVYVPLYDPRYVYGAWWWPDYPPYVWSSFYFRPWDYVVGGIAFGAGISVWHNWHAHHPHPDWHRRNLIVRRPGAPVVWRHDPAHRIGVPYADGRTSERFRPGERDRVRDRRDFRGFDVRPGAPRPVQPRNEVARPGPFPPQAAQPRNEISRPGPFPPQAVQPRNEVARPTPYQPQAVQPRNEFARPAPQVVPRSAPAQQPRGDIARRMPAPAPRAAPSQTNALRPMPNPVARQQADRGRESLGSKSGNPAARGSSDKR